MVAKGMLPDKVVFGSLVRMYYELGNVDEALELQNEMVEKALVSNISSHSVPNIQPCDGLNIKTSLLVLHLCLENRKRSL